MATLKEINARAWKEKPLLTRLKWRLFYPYAWPEFLIRHYVMKDSGARSVFFARTHILPVDARIVGRFR